MTKSYMAFKVKVYSDFCTVHTGRRNRERERETAFYCEFSLDDAANWEQCKIH